MTLLAEAESLGHVTDFVRESAREANLAAAQFNELDLLIEEIFMNIARHSYPAGLPGPVSVTCSVAQPGDLTVEFADQGVAFNPLTAAPPDLTSDLIKRPVGGLGILLLKAFADSLTYRRERGSNLLKIGISSRL